MFNIISKFQNDDDKEVDINYLQEDEIKDEIKEEIKEDNKENKELLKESFDKWKNTKVKINESDSDEDNENVIYVVSIDNTPYYYDKDLVSARKNMWKLAHKYIISDEDDEIGVSNDKYIMTNNPNNIQIVSPLDFLFFRYSNVLHVLNIDYILPF
uniref:Uncharacterized protein n=1 Tax=viral metagenome TaxID=1070528 RepID=A0A6C0E1U6_9ZZZZ